MFTGIVEGVGRVRAAGPAPQGSVLAVEGLPAGLTPGQSIALNGTCLTVTGLDGQGARFDLSGETLRCTNLGDLEPGSLVNFERALVLGERLDGHLVQGHVDGVGVVARFEPQGDDWWLEVEAPPGILAQILLKGSVAVDGISLTVARLDAGRFACTVIPHTRAVTNLRTRRPGARVNLETDLIGKWVARLLEPRRG